MNKIIVSVMAISVILVSIIVGFIVYKQDVQEVPNNLELAQEEIEDDCTNEYIEEENNMLKANANEEKISPNAEMTLTKYYEKCGHTLSKFQEVPEDLVNSTEDELQAKYADWTITTFSDTKIELEKTEKDSCKEHYLVKENEGKIAIYEILEDASERQYEETEISTEYLTSEDKENIKSGIYVNGKKNLNQLIENFE